MARARVDLPSMLAALLDGRNHIDVEGATCREALDDLFRQHPALRVHLLDEQQNLRRHVLCLVNDENTRWHGSLDLPLHDGDRITILQAVSGG